MGEARRDGRVGAEARGTRRCCGERGGEEGGEGEWWRGHFSVELLSVLVLWTLKVRGCLGEVGLVFLVCCDDSVFREIGEDIEGR